MNDFDITQQQLEVYDCFFTTDNGSGNTRQEGIETIVSRIADSDHRISTIITDVLNKKLQVINNVKKFVYIYVDQIPTVVQLIDDVKVVVQYFNQASLQKKVPVTLKSENATQCSSLYTSLSSVYKSFDEARLAIHQNNAEKYNIMSDVNRELLKQLVDFIETFKHATKKLEAIKTTTIHCILQTFIR